MVDYVTPALLAATAFFVAISFGLLFRYRQVSQKMSESTDLGRDLWSTLEQRLRKQDERILDVMARLEVVQSRVISIQLSQSQPAAPITQEAPSRTPASEPPARQVVKSSEGGDASDVRHVASQPARPPESQLELDETQMAAIKLLSERAMSTREITDALGKSREHTARVMKILFEKGLVLRDDSTKPFVYEVTDDGRRYIQSV